MQISNIVLIYFYVEAGCDTKEEVSVSFKPVNFQADFEEISYIEEASEEYISDNDFKHEVTYEVLFRKVVEFDGAGATTGIYYEPFYSQYQSW